jgi:hypothetical protein
MAGVRHQPLGRRSSGLAIGARGTLTAAEDLQCCWVASHISHAMSAEEQAARRNCCLPWRGKPAQTARSGYSIRCSHVTVRPVIADFSRNCKASWRANSHIAGQSVNSLSLRMWLFLAALRTFNLLCTQIAHLQQLRG